MISVGLKTPKDLYTVQWQIYRYTGGMWLHSYRVYRGGAVTRYGGKSTDIPVVCGCILYRRCTGGAVAKCGGKSTDIPAVWLRAVECTGVFTSENTVVYYGITTVG
jgi:hypothetical protein